MDGPASREELRACLRDLERVNRWLLGYRPTLDWLDSMNLKPHAGPIRILDVGCGYGDTLRRIERWAHRRGIDVELTGLDLNPQSTALAAEAAEGAAIEWVTGDVFDYMPREPLDLVVSSLFTHHLADAEVVRFLSWMEAHAAMGWFVNDLSRAPIPYHLFGWFARVMRLHPFVRHDGPVSIARAFQQQDWKRMCAAAGLADDEYRIVPWTPGRLCVSRCK